MGLQDSDAGVLVHNLAKDLKQIIKQPEWTPFVKTGNHKQRPPQDKDWFFVRAAAVMRTVALNGPIGVSKLRTKYGGRKNRGYKPEKFVKGSGNILRKALQELDKAGLTVQAEKGVHKGRVITPKGAKLLAKAGFVDHKKAEKVDTKKGE
ncbi:MAG TPA: 30S ribosomal protein S19e [Alphaproteobacteria bacterium]|nr:30S ribosomal protein S19e [Alphaproteobacteria bacterium]